MGKSFSPGWIRLASIFLCPAIAIAASPGRFQIDDTALVFVNPNRITPAQFAYQTFCVADPSGSGREGLLTSSLDSAGTLWRTIYFDAASGTFSVQPGASVPIETDFTGAQGVVLFVTPVDSSGKPKVYVNMVRNPAFGLTPVGIFDLETGQPERVSLTAPPGPVAHRDLDGDGIPEIILLAVDTEPANALLTVMDAQLTRVSFSGRIDVGTSESLAVGRFSAAARNHVVTGSGAVYSLDGGIVTQVGSIPDNVNGNQITLLAAADIDGDGLDEILALYYNTLRVYDFDTGQIKWEITLPSLNPDAQVIALKTIDTTGDGRPEVMLAQLNSPSAQGYIFIYDGATGNQLRAIPHADAGVFGLNVCDLEGDHTKDIIDLQNNPVTGPDRFYVYDAQTGNQKAVSVEETGPVRGVVLADVEGTGSPQIVFEPDGVLGVGDLSLHARDPTSFQPLWDTPSPFLSILGTDRLGPLAAGKVMGDGHMDLVAGSSQNGVGIVWIVDGPTHTLLRSIALDAGDLVESVAIADVDASGNPKILVGVFDAESAPRLEALDGATGTRLWRVPLGTEPRHIQKIQTTDLNHDGHDDLIVEVPIDYVNGPELYVIDGMTHAARAINLTNVASFDTIDLNGDSNLELALGLQDGSIEVTDPTSGAVLVHYPACAQAVVAITTDRLSSASQGDVLFVCANQLAWMSLASGQTQTISGPIGDQPGTGQSLISFGTTAATDRIVVGNYGGLVHLSPVAALAPYVDPVNARSTNVFAGHWSSVISGGIHFGSFDGSPTTLQLVSQPVHGTVIVQANGTFQYTASGPFAGTDYIVVQAKTAVATSVTTSVPVVLTNSAPNLQSTSVTVQLGSSVNVNLSPSDSDSDPLTLQLVQAPSQGTVSFNGLNVVYTPNSGSSSGSDTFSVQAFDGIDHSAPAVVTVSIEPAATPPPPPPPPKATPSPTSGGGGALDPWALLGLTGLVLVQINRSQRMRR